VTDYGHQPPVYTDIPHGGSTAHANPRQGSPQSLGHVTNTGCMTGYMDFRWEGRVVEFIVVDVFAHQVGGGCGPESELVP